MFFHLRLEKRVQQNHTLRSIGALCNAAFARPDAEAGLAKIDAASTMMAAACKLRRGTSLAASTP